MLVGVDVGGTFTNPVLVVSRIYVAPLACLGRLAFEGRGGLLPPMLNLCGVCFGRSCCIES